MTEFLNRLKPGDGVIDVGANVGDTARPIWERINPGGELWCIEPDPDVAEQCRKAVPEATVQAVALAETFGSALLYRDSDRKRSSLWKPNTKEDKGELWVSTVPLDHIAGMMRNLRAIKVDAQGAECAILKGARKTLAMQDLVWYVEVWGDGLRAAGGSPEELVAAFERAGWRCLEHPWADIITHANNQHGHSSLDVTVCRR